MNPCKGDWIQYEKREIGKKIEVYSQSSVHSRVIFMEAIMRLNLCERRTHTMYPQGMREKCRVIALTNQKGGVGYEK